MELIDTPMDRIFNSKETDKGVKLFCDQSSHFTLGAKKTEEGAASARRSTRIQTSVIEISFFYFSLYVCLI